MMAFSLLLVETSLSAKFITQISAKNMEASFRRRFSHPVPLLLLESSVCKSQLVCW